LAQVAKNILEVGVVQVAGLNADRQGFIDGQERIANSHPGLAVLISSLELIGSQVLLGPGFARGRGGQLFLLQGQAHDGQVVEEDRIGPGLAFSMSMTRQ